MNFLREWLVTRQQQGSNQQIASARRRPLVIILIFVFIVGLCVALLVETETWENLVRTFGGYVIDDTSLEASRDQVLHEEQMIAEEKQGEILTRTSTRDYHNNTLDQGVRYFIYSPSGGFNNQRIELEYALIIAKITKRTLIVPPMGKHSSFFGRYELLTPAQMVPMDKIFDFEKLNEFNPVIAMGNQRILSFVKELQTKYDVKTIFHPDRVGWKEKDIVNNLGPLTSKVLFLRGAEMYHQWGFSKTYSSRMYTTVRFTSAVRKVALDVVDRTFGEQREFNAIHVRAGDYSDRTPPIADFKRLMDQRQFTSDIPLYIATEPSTPRQLFKELCSKFTCKFSKDLESDRLKRFGEAVPQGQIRVDILGVIEQLICVGARHFVGTSFSTFSLKIAQMRKFRSFAFPEFKESEEETSNNNKQKDEGMADLDEEVSDNSDKGN